MATPLIYFLFWQRDPFNKNGFVVRKTSISACMLAYIPEDKTFFRFDLNLCINAREMNIIHYHVGIYHRYMLCVVV